MKIEILILGMLLIFGFSGCTQKKLPINTTPSKEYVINSSDIRVKDFALDADIKFLDVAFANGWAPHIHKNLTPELHELLFKKISQGIKGNGKGERLDIAIINTGLFHETNLVDNIPFVGILTITAERSFKCTGTLNIENSKSSKRVSFEHEIKHSLFKSQEEFSDMISNCEDKILEKTYEFIMNDFK